MKTICIIPIKSNSTRVKNKNFQLLGDKPLYQYIIDHCIQAECFYDIYVDTDSPEMLRDKGILWPMLECLVKLNNLNK